MSGISNCFKPDDTDVQCRGVSSCFTSDDDAVGEDVGYWISTSSTWCC